MEIKGLNKFELNEFIQSKEYENLSFVPISKHRAISHIHNPRALPSDQLLFLAYEEDRLLGYLGVLPDLLWEANESYHCGWLSCLWIDPEQRGKNIAMQLVSAALEAWENKILITEYTAAAERLYSKTKAFQHFKTIEGIRFYRRFELARILPPKKDYFLRIKPILRLVDSSFNFLLHIFSRKIRIQGDDVHYTLENNFDAEALKFIQSNKEENSFMRAKEELNWILNYPWIYSGEQDEWSKKYHFSSIDKRFDFKVIKVYESKKLINVLMISIRNRHLKIPYIFSQGSINSIAFCIQRILQDENIATLSCYHPQLTAYLKQNKMRVFHKKPIQRSYLISKELATLSKVMNARIQDGDGDCSFT